MEFYRESREGIGDGIDRDDLYIFVKSNQSKISGVTSSKALVAI